MIKSNSRIAFIITWFGEWPWYFPYFLHSCKYNPDIDFYIFSDNYLRESHCPQNVHLKKFSIDKFNRIASETLNLNIEITFPYKLCDFKPAYGLIYNDFISKYDYWGYCDIDIIWGDIREFMTDDLLQRYDVLSARHDYLTGSFALYKNNELNLNLFKQSRDYIKVFTNPSNYCFDETNYAFEEFGRKTHFSKIKTEIESMTHVVKRLESEKKLKVYFELQIIEGNPGNLNWNHGKLTFKDKFEIMYYHLIKLKDIYSENLDFSIGLKNTIKIGEKNIDII